MRLLTHACARTFARMHARLFLPRRLSSSVSYEGTRVALTRVGFAEVDGGGARPWYEKREETRVLEEKWI